jgi:hypothetical protein
VKRIFLSLLVLNVLLLPNSILSQQDSASLVITLPQGGFASFKLEVSPLDSGFNTLTQSSLLPAPFVSRVIKGERNVLHRLVADEHGRLVFVYDLVITKLESPKRFGVSARAIDAMFEGSLRTNSGPAFLSAPESKLPTLARPTEQQMVADGGTVALDLLINEPRGVKVVDYVTVASRESLLPSARPSGPARDFAVSNVELAIKNYHLYVDNKLVTTTGRRNCTGAMIWFHLPGRGRFVFSLVPYEGYDFRKVGVIEDNKISFTWNGVSYEWVSREPIVGSGGLWNLWVLHDPNFVDIFAPVETNTKTTEPGRLTLAKMPRGIGIIIPLPKGDDTVPMQSHGSSKKEFPRPIRVVIGGAQNIGELLPKK